MMSRFDAEVRRVRQQAPNLELMDLKASEVGVGLLKFRGADGEIQWRLFDADAGRDLKLFEVRDVPENDAQPSGSELRITSQGVRVADRRPTRGRRGL